jgi:hypothetical protein
MSTATGEFEIASWSEDTYRELTGGAKLTKASVTQNFTGELSGRGEVEWLMCYQEDGSARFVGLQRVEGSLGGRDGTFVAEALGDFAGGRASGTWRVLAATDGLAGLRGQGSFEAPPGPKASFRLEYRFE